MLELEELSLKEKIWSQICTQLKIESCNALRLSPQVLDGRLPLLKNPNLIPINYYNIAYMNKKTSKELNILPDLPIRCFSCNFLFFTDYDQFVYIISQVCVAGSFLLVTTKNTVTKISDPEENITQNESPYRDIPGRVEKKITKK